MLSAFLDDGVVELQVCGRWKWEKVFAKSAIIPEIRKFRFSGETHDYGSDAR